MKKETMKESQKRTFHQDIPGKGPDTFPDRCVVTSEVVAALRAGDHEAFEKVYVHYLKPLRKFVQNLVGSYDAAEEIVQDVFAIVWEKRENIDPSRNIKSYLFTIVKHTALRHIFKRDIFSSDIESILETAIESRRTEDVLEAEETRLLIEVAIGNMPRLRREVFRLHNENMDTESIAKALDISRDNVLKHISRARKDISELISLIIFFYSI